MKIGILTFHEIYNPGAYLQTMGTVTMLRELGHEPVVIDYTPPAHRFSALSIFKNWRLWRHPRHIYELFGRNRAFEQARSRMPLSPKLLTHEAVQRLSLDAVLIGADIVWDYATSYLGQDPVYFGHHLQADKKIAFAVSCGSIPADHAEPEFVRSGVAALDAIAVRDTNTQAFVRRLGREPALICDPAFHLNSCDWSLSVPQAEPYMLVYGPPRHISKSFQEQARRYAQANGLKLIAVCYRQHWVDSNDICIGPEQWLAYVRHATCVLTSTFHGTVFSLREGRPVAAIRTEYLSYKTAAMEQRLPIGDIFVEGGGTISEALNARLDYPDLTRSTEQWRAEAKSFVLHALAETT